VFESCTGRYRIVSISFMKTDSSHVVKVIVTTTEVFCVPTLQCSKVLKELCWEYAEEVSWQSWVDRLQDLLRCSSCSVLDASQIDCLLKHWHKIAFFEHISLLASSLDSLWLYQIDCPVKHCKHKITFFKFGNGIWEIMVNMILKERAKDYGFMDHTSVAVSDVSSLATSLYSDHIKLTIFWNIAETKSHSSNLWKDWDHHGEVDVEQKS